MVLPEAASVIVIDCERRVVIGQEEIAAAVAVDRAALNVNDGFGGGNQISRNLVFNTGRGANKDEGSFNSWCGGGAGIPCPSPPLALPVVLLLSLTLRPT